MTEFKQIIGRGTRINEDYDKLFFTIMDFRKATELFADPAFDGPPISVYTPQSDESVVPPDDLEETDPNQPADPGEFPDIESADDLPDGAETGAVFPAAKGGKRQKYYVNDVEVMVVAERVQYFDPNTGKLITESLRDYTRKQVKRDFTSLDDFVQHWTSAEKKQAIIDELEEQGIFFEALADEVGTDFDPFDLVCHVAFDQPPLTRQERADNVRKRNYFTKYGEQARAVLNALLDKYADAGVTNIEDMSVLRVDPFSGFGSPVEIIKWFGSKDAYLQAIRELEAQIYTTAK